jgi:hypothetical protein
MLRELAMFLVFENLVDKLGRCLHPFEALPLYKKYRNIWT